MKPHEAFRRIFPERMATFEEFQNLIRERKINSVQVHMRRRMTYGSKSFITGKDAYFEYYNRYTFKGVVFDEKYEEGVVFESVKGYKDRDITDRPLALLAVTALHRLAGLQISLGTSIPGLETTLFRGNVRITQDELQKLNQLQEREHLASLIVK